MSAATPEIDAKPATPEELVAQMDALLEQGRAAVAKVDEFYARHGIEPGIGEKMLLSDSLPDAQRVMFSRLFAELEMMEQRIDQLDPNRPGGASASVGARAVGNRYRI